MEYVLETNALCKSYRNINVLNDMFMHVPKGSIYGFVGRNGAGKTTLIRLITGLQNPTSGEFLIYGIPNSEKEINKSRRRMGAVVETPSIYLNMTAEDNLKTQYRVLGMPNWDGISELLALVGLSDTGKKVAKHFSLGMRQRLGIAVALAGSPDFLVLDEPINGLDPQGIIEVRELILKLNKEMGITVLISSHILDELSKLATHYGFIDNGRIVKEISAEDLESSFRKRIQVTTSDVTCLSRALDTLKVEYKVISDFDVEIYSDLIITDLVNAATKEGCIIMSVKELDESLESFYMNVVGGDQNE